MWLGCFCTQEVGSGVFKDLSITRNSLHMRLCVFRGIPPLGLTAFRSTVHALSLPRRSSKLSDFEDETNAGDNVGSNDATLEFKNLFRKHVKPKKLHEIERFCKLVTNITQRNGCEHVFDVGSGLGHLARFLTYGCNLKLTCVDGNDKFAESAT